MKTAKLTTWTKFDNKLLNQWRSSGGSPVTVYNNLGELKRITKLNGTGAIYGSMGLFNYFYLMESLSLKDLEIICLIKKEYNFHYIN